MEREQEEADWASTERYLSVAGGWAIGLSNSPGEYLLDFFCFLRPSW